MECQRLDNQWLGLQHQMVPDYLELLALLLLIDSPFDLVELPDIDQRQLAMGNYGLMEYEKKKYVLNDDHLMIDDDRLMADVTVQNLKKW